MKLFEKNTYFITTDHTGTINGIFKHYSEAIDFGEKCQCVSNIRTTKETVLGYYITKIVLFLF